MADIRTSYTATPLRRGFASWSKARHLEVARRGGRVRGVQKHRAAEKSRIEREAARRAAAEKRAAYRARIVGRCTFRLRKILVVLAKASLSLAARTRLERCEIASPSALMLERRRLAKIRLLASGLTAYITPLGREVLRGVR